MKTGDSVGSRIECDPKVTKGFKNLISRLLLNFSSHYHNIIGNKFTLVEKDYIFSMASIFSFAWMCPFLRHFLSLPSSVVSGSSTLISLWMLSLVLVDVHLFFWYSRTERNRKERCWWFLRICWGDVRENLICGDSLRVDALRSSSISTTPDSLKYSFVPIRTWSDTSWKVTYENFTHKTWWISHAVLGTICLLSLNPWFCEEKIQRFF